MVYAQLSTCPGKWDPQTPLGFWYPNGSPNLGEKTGPFNNKKKRTCRIVDFTVPADDKLTLKVSEKIDKYVYIAGELKKLWNIKVTIIPIVIGALVQLQKDWNKDWKIWKLEDKWRPFKLKHCWGQPEYWEESWRLEETYNPLH